MSHPQEGYVLHSYGPEQYVRHAVASVDTLRRYDGERPVALFCSEEHQALLQRHSLMDVFDRIELLPPKHQSIVGFKHHLDRFKVFDRSLFVDADMIWCRNPDPLWHQFAAFPFTATGTQNADHFFGGPKGLRVFVDVVLGRRRRTLHRFGLTALPRVQAGMIYAQDEASTRAVCERASDFLERAGETHFRSRLDEGRSEETCEWSLAMAMSDLGLHVFPWLQGRNSPQLDYIDGLVEHDPDFRDITYRLYTFPFTYSLRGIPYEEIRNTLFWLAERMPRMGEHISVTPYSLHFGWLHQKAPFHNFANRAWERLVSDRLDPQPPQRSVPASESPGSSGPPE
ncbi:MAG: hypothetical protein ACLFTE_11075 [Salinivenus sp.]